jgi:TolA-binding protein
MASLCWYMDNNNELQQGIRESEARNAKLQDWCEELQAENNELKAKLQCQLDEFSGRYEALQKEHLKCRINNMALLKESNMYQIERDESNREYNRLVLGNELANQAKIDKQPIVLPKKTQKVEFSPDVIVWTSPDDCGSGWDTLDDWDSLREVLPT